jgi:hypothetical protein
MCDIIKLLIEKGADIDHKNKRGETALMVATLRRSPFDIIRTLVKAGADITLKDNKGKNALDHAVSQRNHILKYEAGAEEYKLENIDDIIRYLQDNMTLRTFKDKNEKLPVGHKKYLPGNVTENIMSFLQYGKVKKRSKGSKRSSKKRSKKVFKKRSKKGSKKRSKKVSKRSKKRSSKRSKKQITKDLINSLI